MPPNVLVNDGRLCFFCACLQLLAEAEGLDDSTESGLSDTPLGEINLALFLPNKTRLGLST